MTVVAITGVTGFIGYAIASRLVAAGHRVRALVRSPARLAQLPPTEFEVVYGNLAERSSLDTLVAGATAVIHCAGVVRGATQQAFDQVNVDGTRALLDAMEATGTTTRLLHLSSLAAREPGLSLYARSKYRSEQVLDRADRVAWLALRPPPVYGPGERELLPLFRLMARGIAPLVATAEARFSMLYIDDLAAAALAWLAAVTPPRGIVTLHDGHENGYSWHDLAAIVGELCGRRVRLMALPHWPLDLLARCNRYTAIHWSNRRAPMLTPEKLRELRHPDWVCDNHAIARALDDWWPAVQLDDGLRRTPGWPGYDPLAA